MRGTVGLLDSVTHTMIPLRIDRPRNWSSVPGDDTISLRQPICE
jgi:hypothetical protein